MLADRRKTTARHHLLGKVLKPMRHWPPSSIITDQLGSYPMAIRRLQQEGKLSDSTNHRTHKYMNNILEADYDALKQVIRPTRGCQTLHIAPCHDQRIRRDADDATRTLFYLQATRLGRGTPHPRTVQSDRCRSLSNKETSIARCSKLWASTLNKLNASRVGHVRVRVESLCA